MCNVRYRKERQEFLRMRNGLLLFQRREQSILQNLKYFIRWLKKFVQEENLIILLVRKEKVGMCMEMR